MEQAKQLSDCDMLLCIMSGSFTQRGDICVIDKYDRARHAILGGADCVIELPAAFTIAPAEIFAQGAIKILSAIPEVNSLVFGCESGDVNFMQAAKLLLNENRQFKKILSENLSKGESYIKSYATAFEACGGSKNILEKPNNILGIEYCKAILKIGSDINVIPVQRVGSNFNDEKLNDNYSSASAIRKNSGSPLIKCNVPEYVYADLNDFSAENEIFEQLLRFKLLESTPETLKKIYGCNEGLENRLPSLAELPYNKIIDEATGRRYSSSRIKRILLANLLSIYQTDCEKYLNSKLYIKPIAIKKERADFILSTLAKSEFPTILRQRDIANLNSESKKCFESDIKVYKIASFISKRAISNFNYPIFI